MTRRPSTLNPGLSLTTLPTHFAPASRSLAWAGLRAAAAAHHSLHSQVQGRAIPELSHAELESRTVHSQARGRTVGSGEDPLSLFHGGQDVRPFGLFQSLVLLAILS